MARWSNKKIKCRTCCDTTQSFYWYPCNYFYCNKCNPNGDCGSKLLMECTDCNRVVLDTNRCRKCLYRFCTECCIIPGSLCPHCVISTYRQSNYRNRG